eukprot:14757562-Alexandrium_andersonii.AAC.1
MSDQGEQSQSQDGQPVGERGDAKGEEPCVVIQSVNSVYRIKKDLVSPSEAIECRSCTSGQGRGCQKGN